MNEEYKDENGKKKCTQQKLAEKFGLSGEKEVSKIISIYKNLNIFYDKIRGVTNFEKDHLENLARCKNDFFREKLIEQSIKNKWTSKDIRSLRE